MDYNKLNNMLSELTLETDSNDTEISSNKSVSCFFSRELELKELLQNDLEEFNTQNPRNSKIKTSSISHKKIDPNTSDNFNTKLNDYRTHQFKKPKRNYLDIRQMNTEINKKKNIKK